MSSCSSYSEDFETVTEDRHAYDRSLPGSTPTNYLTPTSNRMSPLHTVQMWSDSAAAAATSASVPNFSQAPTTSIRSSRTPQARTSPKNISFDNWVRDGAASSKEATVEALTSIRLVNENSNSDSSEAKQHHFAPDRDTDGGKLADVNTRSPIVRTSDKSVTSSQRVLEQLELDARRRQGRLHIM